MMSLVAYLWYIYSLLITTNGQTDNVCLWGCKTLQTCMFMNGLFYYISDEQNGRQYYKQDDRSIESCQYVYYMYWYSDSSTTGWFIGYGDGVSFGFGLTGYEFHKYH